jgi:hypothetical protein
MDQLERAVVGQQSMLGILSQAVLRLEERQNEQAASQAQIQAASNSRMDRIEEGLDRLEMLIENMLRRTLENEGSSS